MLGKKSHTANTKGLFQKLGHNTKLIFSNRFY